MILFDAGYVMKYDGEYRRDALKRTSKIIATINLQSISDEILFMRLQSVPRKFKMHKIDVDAVAPASASIE